MRKEQRQVFLAGDAARFDDIQHRVIRPQCVEQGLCWLKNIYFRGDEKFYSELGKALDVARRRDHLMALPKKVLGSIGRSIRGYLNRPV